jgi:hypothetical protein
MLREALNHPITIWPAGMPAAKAATYSRDDVFLPKEWDGYDADSTLPNTNVF